MRTIDFLNGSPSLSNKQNKLSDTKYLIQDKECTHIQTVNHLVSTPEGKSCRYFHCTKKKLLNELTSWKQTSSFRDCIKFSRQQNCTSPSVNCSWSMKSSKWYLLLYIFVKIFSVSSENITEWSLLRTLLLPSYFFLKSRASALAFILQAKYCKVWNKYLNTKRTKFEQLHCKKIY